jgi:hypothetical protein
MVPLESQHEASMPPIPVGHPAPALMFETAGAFAALEHAKI